jgi:uncharacterized membrane protein YhaH (DUF805 family)
MNLTTAIQSGFANYMNFSTRASRPEFWYWLLFYVLAYVVVGIIYAVAGTTIGGLATLAVALGLILPTLGLEVRRLHDLDRSGWWLFIGLVPIVGPILLIVWFCTAGAAGPNRFGSSPLV